MKSVFTSIVFVVALCHSLQSQPSVKGEYWEITDRQSIVLNLHEGDKLPHKDNIEMSGQQVAAIVYYAIDEDRRLTIEKDIIFPQLRIYNKSNEPQWKQYRAYFRRKVTQDIAPTISYNHLTIVPDKVDSVEIGGLITFYYEPVQGLKFSKTIYPSMDQRLLVEEWTVENIDNFTKEVSFSNIDYSQIEKGYKGNYEFIVQGRRKDLTLAGNEKYTYPLFFGATLNTESASSFDAKAAKRSRLKFLKTCRENLVLKTPDEILNTMFYFSKIRAAESIFESSMGLVHSPGGGNYYVGI